MEKQNFPLYRGENVMNFLEQKPLFDTSIFYKTEEVLTTAENEAFIKACFAVNVDPDVVKKQAVLITKLQKMLDSALNEKFNLCAPSFKDYIELQRENAELKAKLAQVSAILD